MASYMSFLVPSTTERAEYKPRFAVSSASHDSDIPPCSVPWYCSKRGQYSGPFPRPKLRGPGTKTFLGAPSKINVQVILTYYFQFLNMFLYLENMKSFACLILGFCSQYKFLFVYFNSTEVKSLFLLPRLIPIL